MKYPVFSYRDKLVGFGSPVVDQNDVSAVRGFSYAINNSDGIMNFQPDNFELYKIGVFDTDKGTIYALDIPELIVSGSAVFEVKK